MKYDVKDFEIDLGDIKINCRPWTSKDERKYLTNKQPTQQMAQVFQMLILPNIKFQPMMVSELEYLIFKLRGKSVAEDVTLNVTCECGQFIEFDSGLEELLQFTKPTITDNTILKCEDIELKMRRIPSSGLMRKVLEESNLEEKFFNEFLACIESLTYKGETETSFKFEEIKEFFDDVPSHIFKDLLKQFLTFRGFLKIGKKVSCPMCKNEFEAVFKDIESFL